MLVAAGVSSLLVSRKPAPDTPVEHAQPTQAAAEVAVHIAGQVRNPGVYRLPATARVQDAIAAAGGVTGDGDANALNLAEVLADGARIDVPSRQAPFAAAASPSTVAGAPAPPPQVPATAPTAKATAACKPPKLPSAPAKAANPPPAFPNTPMQPTPVPPGVSGGPVSLNRATIAELQTVPHIGPALAQRILYYRWEHRGFRSVEELAQVPGFGPKRLEQVRPYVTL